MKDVIARLEAAAEGSRELDVRIWLALFDKPIMTDGGGYHGERSVQYTQARDIWTDDWPHWNSRSDVESAAMELECPHYSTSIDAALTLVPSNWDTLKFERGRLTAGFGCFLDADDTWGATPALALCIAALKARLATPDLMPTEPARRV